jgi:hypothetical protein
MAGPEPQTSRTAQGEEGLTATPPPAAPAEAGEVRRPVAEAAPACLLCLVQTSASMAGACPWKGREEVKLRLARFCVDELLESLADRQGDAAPLGRLDVGVLGVSAGPDGALRAVPLLDGPPSGDVFQPLAVVAGAPLEHRASSKVRRWVSASRSQEAVAPDGLPAPAQAITHAHRLLRHWLARHPGAAAPLVLYVGDSPACSGLAGRSLRLLTTPAGPAVLGFLLFTGGHEGELYAEAATAAPAPWRDLWEESSLLRVHRDDGAAAHARALFVNPVPQRANWLLQQNVARPSSRARTVLATAGPAPPCAARKLWLVKRGNAPEEWEDFADADAAHGVAAVSDGASEGIFAGLWARLLVQSYLKDRPDLERADALAAWLRQSRTEWGRTIDYPALRWSQQNKVDRTGAAATFLALRIDLDGGRAADGSVGWRAWAVGDSCLFWVRGGRLLASFPLVHSAQFAVGPALLRSKAGDPPPVPLVAAGRCLAGDLFVLATDAVAQRLLQDEEEGPTPDWDGLEGMEEARWRERIEALRDARTIVNDDCTLLLVRVQPLPPDVSPQG